MKKTVEQLVFGVGRIGDFVFLDCFTSEDLLRHQMQMWSRQMTISLEFKEEIGLESSACRMNLNQDTRFHRDYR